MVNGFNHSYGFVVQICHLFEHHNVELVNVKTMNPKKLLNAYEVDVFKKNNFPTSAKLLHRKGKK